MGSALYVGPLAALALLLAVFCADAFHLELGVRAETGIEWADGTFAARQTVQARAPRTTGVLALQHTLSWGRRKKRGRRRTCALCRDWCPFADPWQCGWSGFQSMGNGDQSELETPERWAATGWRTGRTRTGGGGGEGDVCGGRGAGRGGGGGLGEDAGQGKKPVIF